MRGWIRRFLTKKHVRDSNDRTAREVRVQEVPPSERLVLITQFSMVAVGALTALELVHIVVLKVWNAEIFAAITGFIGTITGIILGKKT